MACMLLQREPPAFELRFACNFKGCLDDRPMSIMGAIEHQAFHFSEVYKTQVHFNFKCDLCNVYHVNKSHHRLCLDDPTGVGHLPYLRSIYTVPMSDPEFHNCVDFGRFANNHMIAVTPTGGRLLPGGAASYLPLGANRGSDVQSAGKLICSILTLQTVEPIIDQMFMYNARGPFLDTPADELSIFGRRISSYRDLDNCDENGNSEKFGRSGGGYYDRNQNDSGDFRGRGRGGYRGRGDRGGFGRGRGRGGRGGFRGDDDDGSFNGRDNNFRGRGRGRGGGQGRWNDRDDGYNSGRSYGDNGNDVKPAKDRSYSRSRSGSPAAKRAFSGDDRRNNNVKRSYSRSRSSSPCEKPAIAGWNSFQGRI
ncbi:unnamed protein product [Heligmosomoides polygyrus]|uniref:C2H2-type domain-containing protein n=1 Tax=Heligmosomoides polygyrus TaxID=6339 RepID=A0A183FWH5_HELPZ|nr:unnamed protein product [Heligmosomoides polygyrus]